MLPVARNLLGFTGVALLLSLAVGGLLSWIGPLGYVALCQFAAIATYSEPLTWASRPPTDRGGWIAALVVFAVGLAAFTKPELITIPDSRPAGQDAVQVIVDRKVASAQPIRVARRQPGDEPGHQRGFGAASIPAVRRGPARVHPGLRRAGWRGTRQGPLGQPDRGEARVHAEGAYAVATRLGGQVLGELDHRRLGHRVGRRLRPPEHAGLRW